MVTDNGYAARRLGSYHPHPHPTRADRASHAARAAQPTPSSAAGVERVLTTAYVGMRIATMLQMIPALPQGVHVSPQPRAYITLWIAAATATTVVGVVGLTRRRRMPVAGTVLDVALAVVFLLLGAYTVPVGERIGSWVGWAPGYALSVVLSVSGLRLAGWCAAVGAVSAAYVFFAADAVTAANRPTIIGDTLSLLVLGAVARIVVHYIRGVAATADAARAEVAELARREEEYRAQLTMHNATTIMQFLSDPALPTATRVQLCEQAIVEVRRMRAYLRGGLGTVPGFAGSAATASGGGGSGSGGGGCAGTSADAGSGGSRSDNGGPAAILGRVPIRDVLEAAMVGFGDLGLEPALDLADGVTVPADAGEAVRAAVASVLHNVRRHAAAAMVIVHADAEPEANRWIVTIRDDGVGFDIAATPLGTGLRQQVLAELRRHSLTAHIDSTPGLGTRVTIEGRLEP